MSAPRRLLDRAYSNQRRLELRIPGAGHAEFQAGQEPTVSAFERPTALLEVQARIAAQLQKRPDDPALLDSSGEASLLTWSYDNAITSLQQALNSDSLSPELRNDLATGYFERGEAEHRFEDYGQAFELQSQALEAQPRNPVFLFNRAITAERLFLFKQCFEDWENYLLIDPSGSWSEEARNRLASARDRFESHQGRTRAPLLSAEGFSKRVNPFDQATWIPAEQRIDQYLELALTAWMPDAFPSDRGAPKSPAAKSALVALAAVLRKKHNDSWLQDLLAEGALHDIGNPVALLSQAMTADNITEDFDQGSQKSIEATRLFARQGNSPGAMRARFEEIYALHFSDAGGQCLNAISGLWPQLSKKPYSWLKIQLLLEEKICLVDEDVLGASSDIAQNAAEAALEAHYPKLHLRALGFLGDAERLEGKKLAAWRLSRKALQEYWAGSTDDVSGYNIYTLLDDLAEADELWHLDVAVDRQALEQAQSFRDPLTKAALFVHLGVAATKVSSKGIAEGSFATAERLLNEAPRNDVSQNYRIGIDIDRSRLAVQTGTVEAVLRTLDGLNPRLASISNDSIQADYYEVVADAQRKAGRANLAIKALYAALDIAEKRRASLRTEIDRNIWAQNTSGLFSQLVELKLESQDPLGALATLEQLPDESPKAPAKSDGIRTGRTMASGLSGGRTQQESAARSGLPRLSSGTVLVYSVLSDGLAIWKLNNQGIAYRKVVKDPRYIRLLADRFIDLCSTPSSPLASVESTARQLHEILIAPISDQLRPNETLLIVPGNFLAGIPFQALRDQEGRYLIQRHPVVYAAGLRYVSDSSVEIPVTSKSRVLAVANAFSFHGAHLPRLPDATAEAEDVAKHFQASRLLENQDATLANVSQDLAHADVFHFAGHTGSLGGHKGLVLAETPDEREKPPVLDLFLLERLKVSNLKLVVLSSCSTAKEDHGNEDTPEDLAQGFVQLGVAHVVATHWDLDSRSGATLMRMFYGSLLSGKSVAQAMAASESHMLYTAPHPYYWAVYDVFGQQ